VSPQAWVLIQNFLSITDLMQFITLFMGIVFIVMGVFKLKRYGEMRTQMSAQITILSPLMPILVGVALMSFPDFVAGGIESIFGTSNPIAYQGGSVGFEQYIAPILMFIRIIGAGAIIRGLVLLSRAGGSQSQPGMVGKALIHVLGGILALHVMGTIHLVRSVFDI
jgi:intracellular multiplication protein IcmC